MGCVSSKTDINDRHPNIFQVTNVNEQGKPISPGKLQITETELVFYQKGKKPTKWPLRSLRKYGFDIEVFSFECGRRCPTGHGIYAFKCRKAEQLFNVVQQYITGNINDEFDPITGIPQPAIRRPNVMVNNAQTEGYLNPIMSTISSTTATITTTATTITSANNTASTVRTSITQHQTMLSRPGSVSSSNGPLSPSLLPVSPPPATNDAPMLLMLENNNNNNKHQQQQRYSCLLPEPTYTNSNVIMENIISPLPPPAYVNIAVDAIENNQNNHVYMNIDTKDIIITTKDIIIPAELPPEDEDIDDTTTTFNTKHCYANIDAKDLESLRRRPHHIISDTLYNNTVPNPQTPTIPNAAGADVKNEEYKLNYIAVTEVNYAELDLDASASAQADLNQTTITKTTIPSILSSSTCGPVSYHHHQMLPSNVDSPKVEKRKSYATIDFQKTTALSQSINNTMAEEEEGIRKTRHNSTINYNNSLSD